MEVHAFFNQFMRVPMHRCICYLLAFILLYILKNINLLFLLLLLTRACIKNGRGEGGRSDIYFHVPNGEAFKLQGTLCAVGLPTPANATIRNERTSKKRKKKRRVAFVLV